MELWGRKNSRNVMAAIWALTEVGVPFTRHDLGGSFGGLDTDEYGALNPNRVVPTLIDGDLVLWESNAIVRYIARTRGAGSLMPEDPIQAAHADQWMEWVKTTLYGVFQPVFFNMIRLPADKRKQEVIDRNIPLTGKLLSIVDRQLANQDFLAANTFTMGDIPLGTLMFRYFNLEIERPSLPNLEAWYQRICERPAYQQHVMLPFGRNAEEWLALERAGID